MTNVTPFGETVQGLAAKLMDRAMAKSPQERARVDQIARNAMFIAAGADQTTKNGKRLRLGAFPVVLDDPFAGSAPRIEAWDPVLYTERMILELHASSARLLSEQDRKNLRTIITDYVADVRAEVASKERGRSSPRRFSPTRNPKRIP